MEDKFESGEVTILDTGVKLMELGTEDSQEYFSRMFVSAANGCFVLQVQWGSEYQTCSVFK